MRVLGPWDDGVEGFSFVGIRSPYLRSGVTGGIICVGLGRVGLSVGMTHSAGVSGWEDFSRRSLEIPPHSPWW